MFRYTYTTLIEIEGTTCIQSVEHVKCLNPNNLEVFLKAYNTQVREYGFSEDYEMSADLFSINGGQQTHDAVVLIDGNTTHRLQRWHHPRRTLESLVELLNYQLNDE